ncbi:hypothetical protein [Nocardia carnea]|uniref:hypothetical protein n=1 Tax=Nocardia carnea TaxID=37328 RepID=UPI002455870F|nr:hypothetical protein [Nocardia carnea]
MHWIHCLATLGTQHWPEILVILLATLPLCGCFYLAYRWLPYRKSRHNNHALWDRANNPKRRQ